MRMIPETGYGQARASALISAAVLGLAVYAVDRLESAPIINPGERNGQVEACSQHLAGLGHLATQAQIDGTPCRVFLGQFGHDEIVTTYYEAGTDSTDNTGTQTSDTIKYVLPSTQSFRKTNFITPAHARSLREQAKHQGRQALADAFIVGGGFGFLATATISALDFSENRRRTSLQAVR